MKCANIHTFEIVFTNDIKSTNRGSQRESEKENLSIVDNSLSNQF